MDQTLLTRPFRLGPTTALHLPRDLSVRPLEVNAAYWDHAARRPELADGRILSVFDYTSSWTWWELHPVGDELAQVLTGGIDLLLEDAAGRPASVHLGPGDGAVIPAGTWHSARLAVPSTVLFVTPTPARTRHRSSDGIREPASIEI